MKHFFESNNFQRNLKRATLKCKECIQDTLKGEQCKQPNCKKFVEEKDMTKSEKDTRRRGFVCRSCRENVYSMKDLKDYKCSLCKTTGGRRKFDDQNRSFAYKEKKGELKCVDCAQKKFL